MNDSITTWLNGNIAHPGIIACGLRFADRRCRTETNSADFPAAILEETWHRLADTMQGLTLHRIQGRRARWGYENVDLHFIIRGDGTSLGLLTFTGLAAPDPQVVESAVAEFLSDALLCAITSSRD